MRGAAKTDSVAQRLPEVIPPGALTKRVIGCLGAMPIGRACVCNVVRWFFAVACTKPAFVRTVKIIAHNFYCHDFYRFASLFIVVWWISLFIIVLVLHVVSINSE
jgi:hypothetical protein